MSGFHFSSKGFNVVLMILTVSGWGWAISQRMDSGRTSGTITDGPSTAKGSQRQDRAGGGSLASVMSNPRSANLLANFEEILSAAQAGVPNEKLIRACEGALMDGDFECRVRDIALLVEAMRSEDAPALHYLFLRLHREKGLGFPMEYAAFARAWGSVDPAGALEHLSTEKPFRMPAADVANIIGGWAERDPGAALKWIEDHPELEAGNGAYAHLLGGWMVYDRDAATKFLTERQMRPDQLFQSVFHCTNGILYGGGGADESVAWLAALPEEGLFPAAASRAWDITSANYGELPYDHAAQVWGTIADRSWLSFGQFQRFSQVSRMAAPTSRGSPDSSKPLPNHGRLSKPAGNSPHGIRRIHRSSPAGLTKRPIPTGWLPFALRFPIRSMAAVSRPEAGISPPVEAPAVTLDLHSSPGTSAPPRCGSGRGAFRRSA